MIKCLLCGMEKKTAREMHGHMVRMHYEEYKRVGNDMEQLTEGYKRRTRRQKAAAESDRPENLRLLNTADRDERAAYREGYRYIDPDEGIVYTTEEAREEGWI